MANGRNGSNKPNDVKIPSVQNVIDIVTRAAQLAKREAERKKREEEERKKREAERKAAEAKRKREEAAARAKENTARLMTGTSSQKTVENAIPSPTKPGSSFEIKSKETKPATKPNVKEFMNMSPQERMTMAIRNMGKSAQGAQNKPKTNAPVANETNKKSREASMPAAEEVAKIVSSPLQYLWKKNEADKKTREEEENKKNPVLFPQKKEEVERAQGVAMDAQIKAEEATKAPDALWMDMMAQGNMAVGNQNADLGRYEKSREAVSTGNAKEIEATAEKSTVAANELEKQNIEYYNMRQQVELEQTAAAMQQAQVDDPQGYTNKAAQGANNPVQKELEGKKDREYSPEETKQITLIDNEIAQINQELGANPQYLSTDYGKTRMSRVDELNEARRAITVGASRWEVIPKEDKEAIRWIYATQGEEAARVYYDTREREYNKISYNAAMQSLEDKYGGGDTQSRVGAGVNAVLNSPGKIAAYFANAGNVFQNAMRPTEEWEPVDMNSSSFLGVGAAQKSREITTRGMSEEQAFFTNLAISGGEMLFSLPFAQFAPVVMGMTQAGDSTYNALQSGATSEQAFAKGTVDGAAAALLEKLPIDNLFASKAAAQTARSAGKSGAKETIKRLMKQGLLEGIEEAGEEVVNLVSDIAILEDKGQVKQYLDEYIENNPNAAKADQNAAMALYFVNRIGQSFLGGTIMGEVFGGGAEIAGTVAGAAAHRTEAENIGNLNNNTKSVQGLVDSGLASAPGAEEGITEWNDMDGNRVLVPVEFNKQGAITVKNNVNTAFGRDDMSQYLGTNNENVIYTKNNEDIGELLSHGRQLPEATRSNDVFVTQNISQGKEGVKYSLGRARAKVNAVHEKTGAAHLYNTNDTVSLQDGSEAVVVAHDGDTYVLAQAGAPRYIRKSPAEITGKVNSARAVDKFLAPEKKANIDERFDRMHTEKTVSEKFMKDLSEATGVNVAFADLTQDGIRGANGKYDPSTDTIYFDRTVTRAEALKSLAMHEITHATETSRHYDKYVNFALEQMAGGDLKEIQGAVQDIKDKYLRAGQQLTDEQAKNELAAMYTEQILYADQTQIDALVAGNRNMATRIYDAIKTAMQKLGAYFRGDTKALEKFEEYQTLERGRRMFEKALKTREPQVDAEAARAYALGDKKGNLVSEKLKNNIEQVAEMSPVSELNGNEFEKSEASLIDQVSDYFDEIGNIVSNSVIGEVVLNRRGVKDSIAHGIGRKKAAAFKAIPDVIVSGKIIDTQNNWKGRGADTLIIAAPIRIGGELNHMGVVVTRMNGNNRFYLHEVVEVDTRKDAPVPFKTEGQENLSVLGDTVSSLSDDIIPQTDDDVNNKYSIGQDISDLNGLTDADAPPVKGEYVPKLTDANVPPAVSEYTPKLTDTNVPPAQREYVPQMTDANAPDASEWDASIDVLNNALMDDHLVTTEEFRLAHDVKEIVQRNFEETDKRLQLTEDEKNTAKEIARGQREATKLEKGPATDRMVEWASAYAERNRADRVINKYRKDLHKGRREKAEQLIAQSDLWKDGKGIKLATETASRNNIGVMGEDAKAIQEEYYDPITQHDAEATRFINGIKERVKDIGLNKAEALLVQAYGEGLISEAELDAYAKEPIRKIEFMNGEEKVSKTYRKNQAIDAAKVRQGVQVFREIYDTLIDMANEVRIRNGYAPIKKRADYFPHFNDMTTKDKILSAFGFDNTDSIPEGIAGLTELFKPGTKWFGNFQQRNGEKTGFDALEGLDGYLRGIKDVIFHTDDIQNLRALEYALRARHTDETIKSKIDEINSDPMKSPEAKQHDILELLKNTQESNLSNYIMWLQEYTNGLAGKKASLDREMERLFGRKAFTVMRAMSGRVASNMIGFNVGSAITNTFALAQASGQIKTVHLLNGIKDTVKSWVKNDGFADNSDFLVNRRGTDTLSKDAMQKFTDASAFMMESVDKFVSESIVRAAYREEIKAGATPEEAMHNANQLAANILADRSYGQTPTVFNSKNPITKTLTMFQLEVNNQFRNLFKDMPRMAKEKGVAWLVMGFLKYCVAAWITGELFEKLTGRRGIFDPINLVLSTISDFTNEEMSKSQAAINLVSNVVEQIPFVGGIFGGGRVPISSAIPFAGSISDMAGTIGGIADNNQVALQKAGKEFMKPVWFIAPPAGGGAAKKAIESATTIAQGGEYGVDKDGNKKLKFAADGDAGDWVKGLLFGKYATDGGKDYIKNGFQALSVPQTKAHANLVAVGMKPERAQEIIQEIGAVEGEVDSGGDTIEGSKTKNAITSIDKMTDLNPAQKYSLYYDLLMGDKLKEEMDVAVEDYGISKMTLAQAYKTTYGIVGDKGEKGETLNNSKSLIVKAAIDKLGLGSDAGVQDKRLAYLYEMFGVGEKIASGKTTQQDVAYEEDRQKALTDAVPEETYKKFDDADWDYEGAATDKKKWIVENCGSDEEIAAMYSYYMESKDAKEENSIIYAQEMGVRPWAFVQRELQAAGEHGEAGASKEDMIYENGQIVYDEKGQTVSGSKKRQTCVNILSSGYTDKEKIYFYQKQYGSDDNFARAMQAKIPPDAYLSIQTRKFEGEKDANGKTVTNSVKNEYIDYVNGLKIDDGQKLFLVAQKYKVSGSEATAVRGYVDGLNISDEEKQKMLESLKLSGGGGSGRRRSGRRSGKKIASPVAKIPDSAWASALATMGKGKAPELPQMQDFMKNLMSGFEGIGKQTLQQQFDDIDANPLYTASMKTAKKAEAKKRFEERR